MSGDAGNREVWEFERDARSREIAIRERQIKLGEDELEVRRNESANGKWRNPLVIAIAAAALAAVGNAVVAFVNGIQTRELEYERAEQSRILEVIKTGDPDVAAENLAFLVDTRLISDPEVKQGVKDYLDQRQPGSGAVLSAANSAQDGSYRLPPPEPDTDVSKLFPRLRVAVNEILLTMRAEGMPMRMHEGFRSPLGQFALFASGRIAAGQKITMARPWQSAHNFGLAADLVIDEQGVSPWETSGEYNRYWNRMHELAKEKGLETLSFEMPHVQIPYGSVSDLMEGRYPAGGDKVWVDNLRAEIAAWPYEDKPIPPKSIFLQ